MRTRFQMRSIYLYRDRQDQRDVQDIPGRDSDEVAILQRRTHDDGKQTAHRGTVGQGDVVKYQYGANHNKICHLADGQEGWQWRP